MKRSNDKNESGLLHALLFNGKGNCHVIAPEMIRNPLSKQEWLWLHFQADEDETSLNLTQICELDPIVSQSLHSKETRPHYTEYPNGAIIVLRGINPSESALPEDMVSLRIWVEQNRVITVRRRSANIMTQLAARFQQAKAPLDAGEFLTLVVGEILERLSPLIRTIEERLSEMEETLIDADGRDDISDELTRFRKTIIQLKRFLGPERDVVGVLSSGKLSWIGATSKRKMETYHDHFIRLNEDIDALRERSQILNEEIKHVNAERLNSVTYLLTVIAAIFLPLGFLTSLWGVNLQGIPGVQEPNGFVLFITALALIVLVQVIVFKKLKWF